MNLVKIEVQIDLENLNEIGALNAFLEILGGHSKGNITGPAAKSPKAEPKTPKADTKPAAETATETKATYNNPPENTSGITTDNIRTLLSDRAKKSAENKDAIRAKLTEFGAENVSTLAEAHYPAMMEFLNGLS